MEGGDWRTQLQPETRQRVLNKITEVLMRHLPVSGQEGLQELNRITVRFEEKFYTAATNQSDYLRKISLKMVTMETKSQNPMSNSLQSHAASNNINPQARQLDMVSNNWRAAEGQVPIQGQVIGGDAVAAGCIEGGDWRTQLQPDSRQRIVNKITEALKRHLPFSGQEGLQELIKIAVRFEEKIYTAATSQSDYLRKISLKMLTMETKSQNPMSNSLQSYAANNNINPQASNNRRAAEGQVPIQGQVIGSDAVAAGGMEGGDWRTQLQPYSRQRIVSKIMETLKRHLPFSRREGLQELVKITARFEERIYTEATSQSDYLRKTSLQMLTMGTKSQNPMSNSLHSYATSNNITPQEVDFLEAMAGVSRIILEEINNTPTN